MISLLHINYLGSKQFSISFSDGAQGNFDLETYLSSRQGSLLIPLQSDSYVSRAFIEAGALAWPNGLEISPQRIYEVTQMIRHAA
jgi:hypothetical protein